MILSCLKLTVATGAIHVWMGCPPRCRHGSASSITHLPDSSFEEEDEDVEEVKEEEDQGRAGEEDDQDEGAGDGEDGEEEGARNTKRD